MARGTLIAAGAGAFALGVIAITAINAWILMLLLGALHHEVSQDIPAVGYIGSLLVAIALSFIGGFFRSRN